MDDDQVPAAWITVVETSQGLSRQVNWEKMSGISHEPLYTSPPQRELQGLTDEEAKKIFEKHNCTISADLAGILARAIKQAIKEKNT